MSKTDNKPGEPEDNLSATGMFLGGFQSEPFDEPAPPPAAKPVPQGSGPGEFTQMFDPLPARSEPAVSPPVASGEVTRVFATPPAGPTPNQKVRGFSSPGASDSASAEGSFTQVFRTPSSPAARPPQPVRPPPPVEKREWPSGFEVAASSQAPAPPPESMGVTDLFRALSGDERPGAPATAAKPIAPAAPSESFTMLLQRLTEHAPASPQNFETQQVAPARADGQGEFTRIITRAEAGGAPSPIVAAEAKAAPVPAVPFAMPTPPAIPAAPKLEAPKLPAAPKSKLQEMVPVLLVLNAFLLVVLIVVAVLALMHR